MSIQNDLETLENYVKELESESIDLTKASDVYKNALKHAEEIMKKISSTSGTIKELDQQTTQFLEQDGLND